MNPPNTAARLVCLTYKDGSQLVSRTTQCGESVSSEPLCSTDVSSNPLRVSVH